MKAYINCFLSGKYIYHRYIENGIRHEERVQHQPFYGYRVNKQTEWKDIYGNNLETILFDDLEQGRQWKKDNADMLNVYGDISPHLSFITNNYKGEIKPQKKHMNIYNFDIEVYVGADSGFPKASNPDNYINAITFQNIVTNVFYVFSLKDYTSTLPNVNYYKCKDETHLLESIIDFFNRQQIDILTGYNIEGFDIPYIIDRITLLMGEDKTKELSPIRKIYKGTKIINKREVPIYDIIGIIALDYLNLIQKFTYETLESYTLDYVSNHFLGEEKTKFKEEFGDLNRLYDENFEKFITYNIRDVELVSLLDAKLKFIDIAINYAYLMKCNIDDIFGTVKPWDALLYSELYNQNVLCSPNKVNSASDYLGGYVKEPDRGMHNWITVYDIVSSYPNQIISYNISPETIVPDSVVFKNEELMEIKRKFTGIENCIDIDSLQPYQSTLEKYDVAFTCNGYFFKRGTQGFIPKIVNQIFQGRLDIKNQIKEAKKEKADLENMLKEYPD